MHRYEIMDECLNNIKKDIQYGRDCAIIGFLGAVNDPNHKVEDCVAHSVKNISWVSMCGKCPKLDECYLSELK